MVFLLHSLNEWVPSFWSFLHMPPDRFIIPIIFAYTTSTHPADNGWRMAFWESFLSPSWGLNPLLCAFYGTVDLSELSSLSLHEYSLVWLLTACLSFSRLETLWIGVAILVKSTFRKSVNKNLMNKMVAQNHRLWSKNFPDCSQYLHRNTGMSYFSGSFLWFVFTHAVAALIYKP